MPTVLFFLIIFQTYGWKMRQYTSVRLRTTLARSRPRPESLSLGWVGVNATSFVLFFLLSLQHQIVFNGHMPAHNHWAVNFYFPCDYQQHSSG